MNRLKKNICIIAFAVFLLNTIAKAQNNEESIRPAQVTFVTPLGTNGIGSSKTINHFSLNLLWGTSAGVMGAEIGGLLNQTNDPVAGLQMGGLGNISSGRVIGTQMGGLINTGSTTLKGLQMAGLINILSQRPEIPDEKTGGQSSSGVQLSGLVNIHSSELKGFQSAGLINLQTQSLDGMQLAGLINTGSHINGAQMAGLLNKAKTVSGVQIGVINIADTIESGVPIGMFSFVKKGGYKALEIESNESFYANLNFKIGIQRFYSIFSVGFEEQNGKNFWAPGFGFGTFMPVGSKAGINIDAICLQLNEGEWWTEELNQLNKLKINGSYQLARHITFYGGVSVNVLVSETRSSAESEEGKFSFPKAFYKEEDGRTHVFIYPGINAGLRF